MRCSIIYWICIGISIVYITTSQPIDKVSADTKLSLKDEIRYPNGTVVGKYSYTDNEGNPIHVKYYADNTSYGVELNSFKVLGNITNDSQINMDKLDIGVEYNTSPMEPLLDLASEILSFKGHTEPKKPATEKERKQPKKASHVTTHIVKTTKLKSPDYETFYQNEVKAPKQCEKDKVRVYLVKEKRKIRSLLLADDDSYNKYCEQ